MADHAFHTHEGRPVAAVTAAEMREVDRVAVEEVGVDLLQMMENAGRSLARTVIEERERGTVVVLAGNGGNGGGGMAAARHLHNRDVPVRVVLDRTPDDLDGAAARQHAILAEMGVPVGAGPTALESPDLAVDAVIGYGLSGAVRGTARDLVAGLDDTPATVVSLDVPSGMDATSGGVPGIAVEPDRTLTLALPKTGLTDLAGRLDLADISVPATVYDRLEIPYVQPFGPRYRVELVPGTRGDPE